MKKTFDSFAPCLELREVIFLRQLPAHQHLVPALDIFLDPHTKRLHICMEYMDGNLYQLMKAREGKLLEGSVVKSVLYVFTAAKPQLVYFIDLRIGSRFCQDSNTSTHTVSFIVTSSQRTSLSRRRLKTLMIPQDLSDATPTSLHHQRHRQLIPSR